jgi:trehalose-6-phosphatase
VTRLLTAHDLHRALYAGDDTTDLDGFTALNGLELAIRVAVSSPEAPADLAERADLVVDSPASFAELLAKL